MIHSVFAVTIRHFAHRAVLGEAEEAVRQSGQGVSHQLFHVRPDAGALPRLPHPWPDLLLAARGLC